MEQQKPTSARRVISLPKDVPPLSSLYLYIAGCCNLACRHCWITPAAHTNGDNNFLKLSHIKKAIEEGRSLGLKNVKLTGGEPMLHPGFKELLLMLEEMGINFYLETNGTLIDEEMAAFITDKSHLKFISVSLDGVTPEIHDRFRGVKGSHEKTVAGIKALAKRNCHPQLICTLHRNNVPEIEEIIFLAQKLGCSSIKFNHIQKVGRGEQIAAKEGLRVEELLTIAQRLEEEIQPRCNIQILLDIPMAFRPIGRFLRSGCSNCSVRNIIGMLAGGELSLCGIGVNVKELIYGHIETDSLEDVWCNSPGLKKLRELVPFKLEGICSLCIHRDKCFGSCIANSYHNTGKLNAPYFFCEEAEKLGLFPASRKK